MALPAVTDVPPAAAAFVASARGMVIGGRTGVPAASGRRLVSEDPSTATPLVEFAAGGAADVDLAVADARRAVADRRWSGLDPAERGRLLYALADAVERDAATLAALESLDMGMPITDSTGSVAGVVTALRYYAGWPTKITGRVDPVRSTFRAWTELEPIGVCAAIVPWNFPLVMAAHKVGPALAAGNPLVLKPAEQSPLTALRLGELALRAGIPDGVLGVVTGLGETAGAALVAHPDVARIGFTGSSGVGRTIAVEAARGLKRVGLELGGKTPFVVFADADLPAAAASLAECVWENAGQVCMAPTRLLVQRAVHDEVVDAVVAHGRTLRIGPALDPATTMGPLVSARQRSRVLAYGESGRAEGARQVLGAEPVPEAGHFVAPTVFTGVHSGMTIAREEIFGPVLAVIPFDAEAEAVAIANDVAYDLAAAVWTRDIGRAHRVAAAVRTGTVWINTCGRLDPALGFGGYSASGSGRELGPDSLTGYLQAKGVMVGA